MSQGFLHLRLAQRGERWTSVEVIITRSLGYGTYVFMVKDTSQLDPAAALGLLTWDEQGADQNHRELDIEISQWGDRTHSATRSTLFSRYYVPANVVRFIGAAGYAHAHVPMGAGPRVVQDDAWQQSDGGCGRGRTRVHVGRADPGDRKRANEPLLLPVLARTAAERRRGRH